jgi:N-acetylglucosaminyldiphosphoundecaprenol N-acetyl-beta-D-mannosaminyltransferase
MVHEHVQRISILKVPVDIVTPENLESVVKAMYSSGRNHQIILLSLADLMRARRSGEMRTMLAGASLVLPISLPIIKAAKFLKRPLPQRYEPFEFIIQLLSILERWNKSAYLLGSSPRSLTKAEKNIRATFPGLHIVGRHSSAMNRSFMPKVIEAIRKATPTLLMVGKGIPGGERWIPRNLKHFNAGIQLWCSDVFDVFAERRRRPSEALFASGFEWIHHLPRHPQHALRFFMVFRFKLLVLWYRIRHL